MLVCCCTADRPRDGYCGLISSVQPRLCAPLLNQKRSLCTMSAGRLMEEVQNGKGVAIVAAVIEHRSRRILNALQATTVARLVVGVAQCPFSSSQIFELLNFKLDEPLHGAPR